MTAFILYINPEWSALVSAGLWAITLLFGVVFLAGWLVRAGRKGLAVGLLVAVLALQIIIVNRCEIYSPDDWEWWAYGCWGLPSGN